MNKYAIERTIEAIRNDKTHEFNMSLHQQCIMGFATRASEEPNPEFTYTEKGARVLGISWDDARALFFPEHGTGFLSGRKQAIQVLEHLRDTGKVNWKITRPIVGFIHKWLDTRSVAA